MTKQQDDQNMDKEQKPAGEKGGKSIGETDERSGQMNDQSLDEWMEDDYANEK
ncbi:MAG: hypothetical protein HYT10_00780 [Candidatus Levybacteria bacterium]|nr:hypothetical protein [Candidatus Levybacteria bacterium]